MLAGVKPDSVEWGSRRLEFTQFKLCFLSYPTRNESTRNGWKQGLSRRQPAGREGKEEVGKEIWVREEGGK